MSVIDIDKQVMKVEEEGEESPIHGDLLEAVLAFVPLIDLARACHVSKTWKSAVSSSLLHFNKIKPWLVIHTQCTRSRTKNATQAYDFRSNIWITICQPPSTNVSHVSILRTSNFDFAYELSSTTLSFSTDPLHLTWTHIAPPRVWRVDPIIALVGHHIILAGGVSEFGENDLSVEMYDTKMSHWSTCQSMPDILKHSATSTWLAVAANQNKMYVTEKASGITYSFSPETKTWFGPYDLQSDPSVFYSTIGFASDELILAGIYGHPQNVSALKIWKINQELMELDQIEEIPTKFLEKLKERNQDLHSISLIGAENFVCICNSSDPTEFIICEFVVDAAGKWTSVKNLALNDERRIRESMVMSCGFVGIDDLHVAIRSGSRMFATNST